jgi:hypothetical protein
MFCHFFEGISAFCAVQDFKKNYDNFTSTSTKYTKTY